MTAEASWFLLSGEEAAERLGTDTERGLSAVEAAKRLEEYGPNRFAELKQEPRWRAFVRQYRDPMQIVLLVAGIGSIYPICIGVALPSSPSQRCKLILRRRAEPAEEQAAEPAGAVAAPTGA